MRALAALGPLLTLLLPLAHTKADTSEILHYLFLSGKISVNLKDEMHPLTGFDGKRYQVGEKNIKPARSCGNWKYHPAQ